MAEFDDGKDEAALRTIGEVSDGLGIKPHVLRYWEQQFSLLNPLKRSGGRRYYRVEDVALVEEIDRLVNAEGYTLRGADAVLRANHKAGGDRRRVERRSGERRAGEEGAPGGTAPRLQSGGQDMDREEVLSQLRGIRKRLADSIDL